MENGSLKKLYDAIMPIALIGLAGLLLDSRGDMERLKIEVSDLRAEKEVMFSIMSAVNKEAKESREEELIRENDRLFNLWEFEIGESKELEAQKFELMMRLIDEK